MLTPCQKCLRSFLTLPSAFILSDFVDYTKFSGVSKRIKIYFTIFAILSAICALVSIPAYFINLGSFSNFAKALGEKIIFPISVSFFTTFVIVDLKNKE